MTSRSTTKPEASLSNSWDLLRPALFVAIALAFGYLAKGQGLIDGCQTNQIHGFETNQYTGFIPPPTVSELEDVNNRDHRPTNANPKEVVYLGLVPEPKSYVAICGVGLLAFGARRRWLLSHT